MRLVLLSIAILSCARGDANVIVPAPGTPAVTASAAAAATVASPSPSASPVASVLEDDPEPLMLAPHPAADLFGELPGGSAQLQALCGRGLRDRIARTLCTDPPPSITGLSDLQRAFGLGYAKTGLGIFGNARDGNPGYVLLGHTVSLTGRIVSAINPRAILFTPPVHTGRASYHRESEMQKTPDFVALAYTRGEQIVELAARDPVSRDLRFFVVRYEQACNDEPAGCQNHDLFSPAAERNWTGWTLYEDVDLRNTPADCNVCHQPAGHGTPRVLLMQTLRTPWTHFFRQNRDGGNKLLGEYRLAHDGTEAYGGIPGSEIPYSDPAQLQGLIENEGFMAQPIEIPAAQIEQELDEKDLRKEPFRSIAWHLLYKKMLRGEIPGLSYASVDVVDEHMLLRASKGYRAVLDGRKPPERMPWLGDLLLPEVRTHVGLAPKPGSDGPSILKQMCRRCHNPSRDQSIPRARFDVDKLAELPAEELDRAIKRLTMPFESGKRMPPPRFALLSDAEIALVVAELERVKARASR